ncbi:fungal-specific transcription factor domain-containing protein [Pseudomassariella vexata]|uniref:Fungal-specific transcription factor domain-domain-containing protein n=1 Tax=Pseudomassariella vexata TaxID=1141098 RepID=A0A1Y2DKI6_9PEZI|nr:fungal-specific transcription factor domain-containing protein [Pseudomassariella vexata]ORY59674.1 fungal-specific transcription factor domain-domain-containing protein [Pseudomassariella vexata]
MDRPRSSSRVAHSAKRMFPCTFDGCDRSFTRSEHLHRHSLNHTDGQATCPRCRAHFKRKDLLDRHLNRHRQKDDEAGGEGHGQLNTRKRMWKDLDGRIVQKRPKETSSEHISTFGTYAQQPENPISPPGSSENPDLTSDHGAVHEALFTDNSLVPEFHIPSGPYSNHGCDAFWMSSQQPGAPIGCQLDINYDDVFQPDTASSFNMPYTTQVNYDWLFKSNSGYDEPDPITCSTPMLQQPNMQDQIFNVPEQHPTAKSTQTTVTSYPPYRDHNVVCRPSPESLSSSQLRFTRENTEQMGSNRSESSLPATQSSSNEKFSPDKVQFERPLSFLRKPEGLPSIDEDTYTQLLQIIEAARPPGPDGDFLDVRQALLSLTSLQTYSDLFFTKFNTVYPLIHQATFDKGQFEPLLLLSIILLGATYCNKDTLKLAVCIHDVIRPQIFAHAGFSPKPELWMLQTILLVECFGKSRAGQKQHDMSHLFHGMLINLIRRSDCQSVRPSRFSDPDWRPSSQETSWRQWAEAEEKKRLALLCFMWDTQHAVLFCQSLCMSAFELRVALPCDQTLWEASSAAEWSHHTRLCPPEPMYLLALKSYLTSDAQRPLKLNGLSRIILFHGLMSIFWDMKRRDQTSLGVISSQSSSWQSRLEKAYQNWKVEFDSYCSELSAATEVKIRKGSVDGIAKVEIEAWQAAYVTVYHAAQVLLRSEFLDIQIFAGARHILGNQVQRVDYNRSERVVRRWGSSSERQTRETEGSDAATAAWHAAHLLQAASQNFIDYDSMGLFHVPWCLYLATLTIWAFHYVGLRASGFGPDHGEIVWDAQAEMNTLVKTMTDMTPRQLLATQGSKQTGGLVCVVAGALSKVRWGIVHAGVAVLKGLVPGRLIGGF